MQDGVTKNCMNRYSHRSHVSILPKSRMRLVFDGLTLLTLFFHCCIVRCVFIHTW